MSPNDPRLPALAPPVHGPAASIESEIADFPELWRTLNRYKWGVLGIALLTAIAASLWASQLDLIYRATVTLLIEPRPNRVVQQVQDVYDPAMGTNDYYGTQYKVLASRDISGKVVDRLGLVDHAEFRPKPPSLLQRAFNWRSWLPFIEAEGPPAPPADPAKAAALKRESTIDAFVARVGVEPVVGTQLVKVHFKALSPEFAAGVSNAIADVYIDSGLDARLGATQRANKWLNERLGEIQTELAASEKSLQDFREEQELVSTSSARRLLEEELVDASRKQREAQKRRTELQNTYAKIQQAGDDYQKLQDISPLLVDPPVQRTNEAVREAREAIKQMEERYGAKHPSMSVGQARLDAAITAHREQLRIAAGGIKAEYEIARNNENAAAGQVAAARAQIRNIDRKEYEFSTLQRDVDTNKQLYDLFLQRFKETDSTESYENLNARVVDPAVMPRVPAEPNKPKIVVVAAFLGLLLGLLLAMLRHLLQEGLQSVDDVERVTHLPVLAILPLVTGKHPSLPKLFVQDSRTPYAEGVRSVRAALRLSDVDKRFKRIIVTSAVPEEGKSSLAGCLAIALGALERVVLVEADLRAPSLRKMFGIPDGRPGILELLSGEAKAEDCIYHDTASGIYILAASKLPPNPGEVVASAALHKLMDLLASRFDRVIVDTPPLHAASDCLVLSQIVDTVLLLIKSDKTSRRAVRAAVKQLHQVNAHVAGTIINQVDVRKHPEYYGSHYYAYGYYGR